MYMCRIIKEEFDEHGHGMDTYVLEEEDESIEDQD